jgi:hypothetical protein
LINVPEPRPSIRARLSALAQRLGLLDRGQQLIMQRASQLQLPFKALPPPKISICWNNEPQLLRLVDLPRGALSGPVQEDKSDAHAMLIRLVKMEEIHIPEFDLRQIKGLSNHTDKLAQYSSLEDLAASELCRKIRIISYKDFVRTLSLALPGYLAGDNIHLRQASWLKERYFWAGEQHSEAFASAIAYARLRKLEIKLPATLNRYRLSEQGLKALQQHYHVLAMPNEAWSNPDFMALLLDNRLPYARLSLNNSNTSPEVLMLPKRSAQSAALGEGLLVAGAPDIIEYLQQL